MMATDSGQTAQRQIRKPVDRPIANSATATSNNPAPATPPSQRNRTGPKNDNPGLDHTLYRELELEHSNKRWFDSYPSLNPGLCQTTNKRKDGKEIRLADLQVPTVDPTVEDKPVRYIGLLKAVQKYIEYLLEIEAKWNPVTRINRQPQDCLRPLWNGQLFLGGIKDSGNVKPLILSKDEKYDISAVVSVHPDDWLAKKIWKSSLVRWDGRFPPPERTNGKAVQYLFELEDDSGADLIACFPKAFRFMNYYLSRGQNVLVHCKMGQSRSASLVLGYMVKEYYAQLPPEAKVSTNMNETLNKFTTDLMKKRKAVKPGNFRNQVLRYLEQLATGDTNQPSQQPKPAVQPQKKKGGGGIIKDAVLVLCYLNNLKPTREILEYWSSRKDTNQHYWIAAAKKKTRTEDRDDKYYLALFNKFFEDEQQWRARQRTTTSA